MGLAANLSELDATKLAGGATVTLLGKVANSLFHFISQIILARFLEPSLFGIYALGWTLLSLVELIAPLGLERGVLRFGSRYSRAEASGLKSVILQSLGIALTSGLLISLGVYCAAPWLADSVFHKPALALVIRGFAFAFPLLAGLNVASAATRISQQMKFTAYAEDIAQPLTNLILVALSFYLGWGLAGSIAAAVISFGAGFLLAGYYLRRLFPEAFSPSVKLIPLAKDLLAFSLPASGSGVLIFLVMRIDRLLLGHFRPTAEVGIYQAISQLSIIFVFILAAFGAILAPMITELYHKNEMQRLEELYRISTKWGFYLSLPVCLTICFAPRGIVLTIFGLPYVAGAAPLVILTIGQLVNVGTGAVGPLLIMTGHQNRWLLNASLIVVATLVLNWILIPRWGLIGAALGTTCALIGLYLLGLRDLKRLLNIGPYDRRYLKGLLAAASAGLGLLVLHGLQIKPVLLNVALVGLTAEIIFWGMLLVLGLDAEDRRFIQTLRASLTRLKSKAGFTQP
jgi:O-antigen/teichoic acid export membrane protein